MKKNSQYKILIADDEQSTVVGVSDMLELEGYQTRMVSEGREALNLIEDGDYNLLLVDYKMPGLNGLEILEELKKRDILTEVIMITGQGSTDVTVKAMKAGAFYYLEKSDDAKRIKSIVKKALEHNDLNRTNRSLQQTLQKLSGYGDLIGGHEKIRAVYKLIDSVADTTANVLITGESGTGKELVANAIHRNSGRSSGPFIAVNCSAFPRDILENELFGHEKGAFTGATNAKAGCFEMADGGTLFLDEIGEMPSDTQSKLLRALEERKFRRLGGTREIAVDVRIIAATNQDIQKALQEGKLREDLYFRLCVMEIEVPPLRERMSDLNILAEHFLKTFNEQNDKQIEALSKEALDAMHNYSWPGNIRELRNAVERAVILCQGAEIELQHLPKQILQGPGSTSATTFEVGKTLEELERDIIFKTLEETKNNKTKAAKILGISLKTMHNKINKYLAEDN